MNDHNDLIGEVPEATKEEAMGGAYDGASRFDKMLAAWQPPMQSADMDIIPEKDRIDARVADTYRNDGYVNSGVQMHRDNIVGHAYLFNSKPNLVALGLKGDTVWEEEFQEELESVFGLLAESPDNWTDAARQTSLTGQIRLAVGCYALTGEVLAEAVWSRANEPRPFRSSMGMLDPARLSTPWDQNTRRNVRGGVHQTQHGAPLGYYITKRHPNDLVDYYGTLDIGEYNYIRARRPAIGTYARPNILHVFEAMRPGQSRGVSAIVAGLKELKITKSFREVTLQNAVVNAMFAAAIESELPTDAVMASIGAGKGVGGGVTEYAENYLGALSQYVSNANGLKIDGVRIPHLFPGTKLNLLPAGNPGGVGQDFEKSLVRYISAILGVSYEQLSHDYSETNYSSARAAMNETWKFMQARKRMVADRVANFVLRLWFEEAVNLGKLSTMQYSKLPNMYEGMNFDAYTQGNWIGASRGQIDELKETQAAVLRMKYHISTLEDEQSRLGKDWRVGLAQAEREMRVREERGLTVDESNAINAASGTPRESEGVDDNGEETNERNEDV